MKYIYKLFFLSLISLSFFSCSSLESDAKKASELSRESIEHSKQMNFGKAEQAYRESLSLFKKYEEKGQLKEFTKLYNSYLEEK